MTPPVWIALGAVALLLAVYASTKKSRPDGVYVRKLHPYRRLMPFIMPTRNESVVYFDTCVDATELARYLAEAKTALGIDVTHCLVAATATALARNPKMNRFVVGRRLYQRQRVEITFSMKRKALDKEAKLSVVKIEVRPGDTIRDLARRIDERIGVERSGRRTAADREYDLFNLFGRPILAGAAAALRWLDAHNLLPAFFIDGDGLYSSMVIANLGSLGMGPGYHHLYEWGTCPLFLMVGRLEDAPAAVDGQVVVRPTLHLRWSFDERIDDGLTARDGIRDAQRILEDPFNLLGGLGEAPDRPLFEAPPADPVGDR